MLCLLGQDATLCAHAARAARSRRPRLYRQLYEAAGDIKPKNISIDTLSRAFAGNEIDRVQVYAFAMHMQALAMVAGGSVTVLSHPSLQRHRVGLRHLRLDRLARRLPLPAVPQGRQGRRRRAARQRPARARIQEEPIRPDSARPSCCATSTACSCRCRAWPRLDKLAREAKADEIFLDLLRRFAAEGRNVSDKQRPHLCAGNLCQEEEAKRRRHHRQSPRSRHAAPVQGRQNLERALRQAVQAAPSHRPEDLTRGANRGVNQRGRGPGVC